MKVEIMQSSLKFLNLAGLWPGNGRDTLDKVKLRFWMIKGPIVFLLILLCLHLGAAIKNKSTHNVNESIIYIVAEVGIYYYEIMYLSKLPDIVQNIDELATFREQSPPSFFKAASKRLEKYARLYKTGLDLFTSSYLITACFAHASDCHEVTWGEVCAVAIPTWLPFRLNLGATLLLVAFQSFCAFFTMKTSGVCSFSMMQSIELLTLRVRHVKQMFRLAIETRSHANLIECVKYHAHLLDLGARMSSNYNWILFGQTLTSAALYGFIGYQIQEALSTRMIVMVAGWFVALLTNCVAGQRLINESESVADLVYATRWYETDPRFVKTLTMVIARSHKPLQIKCGPFNHLSHDALMTVLKAGSTYMTMMSLMGRG